MTARSAEPNPGPARVGVVVPAAGQSRRMGRPKPLLPLGDSDFLGTILGTCSEVARRCGARPEVRFGPVAVVHRWGDASLEDRVAQLAAALPGLEVLPVGLGEAEDPAEACAPVGDMLWSVWQGARALLRSAQWRGSLAGEADGPALAARHWVLVWPVDMPLARPATVEALVLAADEAAASGRPALLVPWSHGEGGHPVAVPIALLRDGVGGRTTPGGLAALVRAAGLPERRVPVDDPGCAVGANTPEQYAWLCALWAHGLGAP